MDSTRSRIREICEPLVPMLLVTTSAFIVSLQILAGDLLIHQGLPSFGIVVVASFGGWLCNMAALLFDRRRRWRRSASEVAAAAVAGSLEVTSPAPGPFFSDLFGDFARLPWLFFRALAGFLGIAFTFLSCIRLSIGDTSAIFMTAPLYAAVLAALLLKEPFHIIDLGALMCGLTGVVFITRPVFLFGGGSLDMLGVAHAVLAAWSASFVFIAVRRLTTPGPLYTRPLVIMGHKCFHGTWLGLVGVYLVGQQTQLRMPVGAYEWGLLACLGPMEFLIQLTMTLGLSKEKVGPAASMRLWDVVFAFVWQKTLLNQPVPPSSVMGSIMVSSAMVFTLSLKFYRTKRTKDYGKLDVPGKAEVVPAEKLGHGDEERDGFKLQVDLPPPEPASPLGPAFETPPRRPTRLEPEPGRGDAGGADEDEDEEDAEDEGCGRGGREKEAPRQRMGLAARAGEMSPGAGPGAWPPL